MASNIDKLRKWLADMQAEGLPPAVAANMFLADRCPAELDLHSVPRCHHIVGTTEQHCKQYRAQYRPIELRQDQKGNRYVYARYMADADAQHELDGFKRTIDRDIAYLRTQIPLHGDTVLGRWKNKYKTREKKAALLRNVFQDLEERRGVEPRLLYDAKVIWCEADARRTAWLLPYLSVEALLQNPLGVMHLLHDTGWEARAFATDVSPGCVIMYGPDYGKLTHFVGVASHQWYYVGYPRARLIMEAQALLYTFIRSLVEALLDGATLLPSASKWNELVAQDTTGRATAHVLRSPMPSLQALCELTDARKRAAEDELWLLQTDPAYVQHLLQAELSSTACGKMQDESRWSHMTGDIFHTAIYNVDLWHSTHERCKLAASAFLEYGGLVGPKQASEHMPMEYRESMLLLEAIAEQVASIRARDPVSQLLSSKAFEKYYHYKVIPGGVIQAVPKAGDKNAFVSDRKYYHTDELFWALQRLPTAFKKTAQDIAYLPAEVLLDTAKAALESRSIGEKRKIDQRILVVFADIQVTEEILCAVQLRRPRINSDWEWGFRRRKMFYQSESYIKLNMPCPTGADLQEAADRLADFYTAQWPKGVHNSAWLLQATTAREKLSNVWHALREEHRQSLERAGLSQAHIAIDLARLRADDDSAYIAELESERALIARRMTPGEVIPPAVSRLDLHFGQASITDHRDNNPEARRQKIKTRPQGPQDQSTRPQLTRIQPAQPAPVVLGTSIQPKSNNVNLFRKMFPSAAEPATKGSVSWQHFASAMADAGFSVGQSQGSAVMFSRAEGSIVIHRPHSDPTLTPLMLEVIGKRLGRWFGWHGEMFSNF